ncbi:MAG: thiamine-phosphate kinase [Candidatus Dormibacteraeota bacterium]|uniref:Thiamine-monophosphate kinase n=1 Tax=Candidatus Aeolococcus gillhamiae TaxID=3127015 RepID=A0A2W5ZBX4_9BACT|nr:thiamine-phosphate kinase [Candidatus Dormibacteraeota bacterium]PZR81477.1 MAG: thiamine-phosphate kinase [Candidatus Dormibacter sp. RRmetagenome_bin12]
MSRSAPPVPHRDFGAGGPTLAQTGERALLEQLVAISAAAFQRAPAAGDDAAVWTPPAGRDLAVSVDALVEDVDFRRGWIGPRQLGRRAFGVAVSDLAGTGAEPLTCLATLCARPSEQLEDVLEIQRGLCEAAAEAGCAVVGGDVSAIDGPLVIDVCVSGSLPTGRALRRAAGRAGDLLLVTGVLGRSAAGLRLLLDGLAPAAVTEQDWVDAHLQPVTRLREGARLLEVGVRCAGDVSDGVLVDAERTARASSCAVEIWRDSLPVDAHLSDRFGQGWLELAVAGGEDFELLAATPESDAADLMRAWPGELAPLTVIGALTAGSGLRLLDRRGGIEQTAPRTLAAHFS